MNPFFFILAVIFALADWIAVSTRNKPLEYLAKPAVMVALLAGLWLAGGFQGGTWPFAVGLFFSLLGDVFLMLPQDLFIPGLISFLLAHLAYIVGFTATDAPAGPIALVLVLPVMAAAAFVFRQVRSALVARGEGRLTLPILIYTLVISLMLLAALVTLIRPEWPPVAAILASAGALLFFISDGVLAWNRFVTPLSYGPLVVIITYHLGQALISLSAIQRFLQS
jgi:uncharacterized membrane protein YhhN